jgi:hypothetical protein
VRTSRVHDPNRCFSFQPCMTSNCAYVGNQNIRDLFETQFLVDIGQLRRWTMTSSYWLKPRLQNESRMAVITSPASETHARSVIWRGWRDTEWETSSLWTADVTIIALTSDPLSPPPRARRDWKQAQPTSESRPFMG